MSKHEDFPAAHSMDTSWFALDKHGHLGVFDTYEAGAVPNEAEGTNEDGRERLQSILSEEVDLEFYVDDIAETADAKIFQYIDEGRRLQEASDLTGSLFGCLLWLADASTLTSASRGRSILPFGRRPTSPSLAKLPHKKHVLAWAEDIESTWLLKLRENGGLHRAWVMEVFPLHRMGVFEYSHGDRFENWVAGPYVQDATPMRPLRTLELRPSARAELGQFRLPRADFRRDLAIQPRDEVECESWGEDWLSLEGEAHGTFEDE